MNHVCTNKHRYMGVSENRGNPPNDPFLIRVSIILTIHFGVITPIFGNIHIQPWKLNGCKMEVLWMSILPFWKMIGKIMYKTLETKGYDILPRWSSIAGIFVHTSIPVPWNEASHETPLKIGRLTPQKEAGSYSNDPFSAVNSLLVSGRVNHLLFLKQLVSTNG